MADPKKHAQADGSSPHPVDEILPASQLFAYGLQHVLVMYAGAIAVPLIIGKALKLTPEQIIMLINADLFTCGIATIIRRWGSGRSAHACPLCKAAASSQSRP